MSSLQAILLGIIQGLTEFLPVSSSGHLVIFQHLFGLKEPAVSFNISVHVGTLIVVIIVFRREIWSILFSFVYSLILLFKKKRRFDDIIQDTDFKLSLLIITGSFPTAIIGLFFKSIADKLFSSIMLVGLMLIVTGFLLLLTRNLNKSRKGINLFSFKDAAIIGITQGLAIIPGISRSGSTIAAGLFLGLDRETAAKYSFLLSIPAIIGAEILNLRDFSAGALFADTTILFGVAASFITGYCALKLLLYIVKKGNLHLFAPYCWAAGVFVLIRELFFLI